MKLEHAAVALAVLALTGCQPRDFTWEYRVADAIDPSTRALQAHLREGGCASGRVATYRFARGEAPPVPPIPLDPGTWGFEVEALDDACRPIGVGCEEVELPGDGGGVLVEVTPGAVGESVCPGRCAAGICQSSSVDGGGVAADAGPDDAGADSDAGVDDDAGADDAGADDAGPDDAGADDAGADDAGADAGGSRARDAG